MSDIDIASLRKMLDDTVTQWAAGVAPTDAASPANEITEVVDAKVLPEGKRAVRTKTSGDRVYILDDADQTRRWVTSSEVLSKLGFEMSDVVEIDDTEMMKYKMGPAIYKVD